MNKNVGSIHLNSFFVDNDSVQGTSVIFEVRPNTAKRSHGIFSVLLMCAGATLMVKDEDIDSTDAGRRENMDAFGSDVISEPVSASVAYRRATHDMKSLESLELRTTTADHAFITCSSPAVQKGDVYAPNLQR